MANIIQYTQNQAHSAKYWYERIPYTYGPVALAAGWTTAVNVSGINKTKIPQWLARFGGLAATQNAGVALDLAYDNASLPALADQGFTDALPAGVRELAELDLPAKDRLVLRTTNTTGAPVAGYQLNYTVAMQRLTLAEKLLRGITQLTADEQEALARTDVKDLVDKGIAPIPIESMIERTYRNRIVAAVSRTYHVDVGVADAVLDTIRAAEGGPDTFLLLREIAVEGADAITVSFDRDQDSNYVGLAGDAFVEGDGRPWRAFLPALDYLTIHTQAAAPVAGARIRVGYWQVKLSNLLRVRFGLAVKGEVPDATYYRAIAGVA